MLVLSRGVYESVRIGECVVTIVSIRGQSVRIGIDAPRDVVIARAEVDDGREKRDPLADGELDPC